MVNTSSPAGLDFLGQDRDEVVRFYFRQHWVRLLRPVGKMLLWSVILGVAFWFALQISSPSQQTTRHLLALILCLLFLYAQLEFLNAFFRHFLYVLVVTNKKIHRIKKTLFVVDDHQSIDVTALQDVHKSEHGIVQNVLRFGTLTLEAQESVLKIHFVHNVAKMYHEIIGLREWSASHRHEKTA